MEELQIKKLDLSIDEIVYHKIPSEILTHVNAIIKHMVKINKHTLTNISIVDANNISTGQYLHIEIKNNEGVH